MLFTAINYAALGSGMGGFKYQTDEEESDELDELVDFFTKRGVFN